MNVTGLFYFFLCFLAEKKAPACGYEVTMETPGPSQRVSRCAAMNGRLVAPECRLSKKNIHEEIHTPVTLR